MLTLTASNLDCGARVAHAFFGRKGGVSDGIYASLNCGPGSNDVRLHVQENRRRAMETMAGCEAGLITLYQVHGRETVVVHEPWEIGRAPKADAMVTRVRGVALGILTADCAPVLLVDAEGGVIGAAHAGWKGAHLGVIESVVAAAVQLGAQPQRIAAAVGPCICQDAYEVGEELRDAVTTDETAHTQFFSPSTRAGHWQFDLQGYVQARLRGAGVENISPIPACTYLQETAFFSYRRATHRGEADYGRQLSAIMLD